MRTITLTEIRTILTAQSRLIALDVSKASIGVAVATFGRGVVTPLTTIKRAGIRADATALMRIIDDYGADILIVGWPLNMDGTVGARCQSVKDSMVEIMKFLPEVPILFQDERLSTRSGDKMVDDYRDKLGTLTNKTRKTFGKKASAPKDHMAAKAFLEEFLQNI